MAKREANFFRHKSSLADIVRFMHDELSMSPSEIRSRLMGDKYCECAHPTWHKPEDLWVCEFCGLSHE